MALQAEGFRTVTEYVKSYGIGGMSYVNAQYFK